MFLGEFSSSNDGNVILINLPKVINENLMDVSGFLWKFFQRTLKHIEFSLYPTSNNVVVFKTNELQY